MCETLNKSPSRNPLSPMLHLRLIWKRGTLQVPAWPPLCSDLCADRVDFKPAPSPKAHTGLSDSVQFFLNPGADLTQAMTAGNFLFCVHEAASSGGAQIASGNGICCQGACRGEEVRNFSWQWHNLSGSLSFCSWNKPAGTLVMLTHHQPGCTRSPSLPAALLDSLCRRSQLPEAS